MSIHPDIHPDQHAHILSELRAIEAREQVTVLFAVESGSRAWGFPSPDSDYDVRFVYAHTRDWYVSLQPGRDVIELPLRGDDDISGWDIRKALNLALKPNPVLLEWLASPIRYIWQDEPCRAITAFARTIAQGTACAHHYRRMAELQSGDGDEIKLKRYFYALRAAMALRWIDTHAEAPPMNFIELMEGVDLPGALRTQIDLLIEQKRQTVELGSGPRIPALEAFIQGTVSKAAQQTYVRASAEQHKLWRAQGDDLFRNLLQTDTGT